MTTPSFTPKTFPGVYTQIVDKSFFTPTSSRFKPGFIGVATKGPFNTPVQIQSLNDFVANFGNPIPTVETPDPDTGLIGPSDGTGYFMADAVDACSDYTNQMTVIRIGKTFTELPAADGVGTVNNLVLNCPDSYAAVNDILNASTTSALYISVTEPGKKSTVNAVVTSASNGTLSILSGLPLQDSYDAGQISYSVNNPAAFTAESVVSCYTYGSGTNTADHALSLGTISNAVKNTFQFTVSSNITSVTPGMVLKIQQSSPQRVPTLEVRVASRLVNPDGSGTVFLETASIQQIGYQALPLQDNYSAGAQVFAATGSQSFMWLSAASPGSWANGTNSATGLYVKVRPGYGPGTKKLEVYWNSALEETHDNITNIPGDANYWDVRLAQGISKYVYVSNIIGSNNYGWTPANTVAPWDARFYTSTPTVGLPVPMPAGAINAGTLVINGVVTAKGGQFVNGADGETLDPVADSAVWTGTLDPVTDKYSGIRAFENKRKVDVNVIILPMDNVSLAILSQLASTCFAINAIAVTDVPSRLNARQAIDWHNGQGQNNQTGKLDSHNVAVFWNWGQRTNSFGVTQLVPPSVFWARAAGFTFNSFAPWYAIAGETRGYLPDCEAVQFDDVSEDTLQAMYGNGNSVNPILNMQGNFFLYGERTMQRLESKLTAIHSVICVNWTVNGLAQVFRRFVFDPNDAELLTNMDLAGNEFLARIKNDRGLEDYNLSITASADDRNNRQVICNLALIPADVAEKIYINATVYESGAVINSIS